MIDLTPLDVRKKRGDFRRILRGYDPEEVDTFLELAAERLEELVKNNLVLLERVERLERSVNALELRESAVQEALVTAQRLRSEVQEQSRRDAETMKDQSQREAQLLKAEAEAEIARRLGEVEGLVLESRRSLEELERSRRKFLKAFRGLLERELDTVEVEEARTPLDEIPVELELSGWFGRVGLTGRGPEADGDDAAPPGSFDTQILTLGTEEDAPPAEDPVWAPEAEEPPEEAAAVEEEASAVEEEASAVEEEAFAVAEEVSPSDVAGDEVTVAGEAMAPPEAGVTYQEPSATGDDDSASDAAHDVLPVAALAPDSPEAEGAEAQRSDGEPTWLFSLLKRADQVERKGDV
jgi:cell division initiation protein